MEMERKKLVGILGITSLLAAIALSQPRYIAKASEGIVETQPLPELPRILTDEELSILYTCKQDIRKENTNTIELSYEDAQLLLKVGRSEGGPGLDGQLWVMNTIYNRYEQKWGKSIWTILNDSKQFSVVTSGAYKTAEVNVNSHLALAQLEMGIDPTEGALYWEANTNSPDSWHKRNLTFIKEVEGNLFYR